MEMTLGSDGYYRRAMLELSYSFNRMTPLKPINTPLLRKGVEWVLEQAQLPLKDRQWDQQWWRKFMKAETGEVCGTRYCLAGYLCETDPSWEWSDHTTTLDVVSAAPGSIALGGGASFTNREITETAAQHAREMLGLTDYEAGLLWSERNTAHDIVGLAEAMCKKRGEELGITYPE